MPLMKSPTGADFLTFYLIYTNWPFIDDTKFLLDLFELIANSRFYDAYQKVQFMREYLFGAVPREILMYLRYVGKNENGLK